MENNTEMYYNEHVKAHQRHLLLSLFDLKDREVIANLENSLCFPEEEFILPEIDIPQSENFKSRYHFVIQINNDDIMRAMPENNTMQSDFKFSVEIPKKQFDGIILPQVIVPQNTLIKEHRSDGNAEVMSENAVKLNFPIEIQQQYFERVTLPKVIVPQNTLIKEHSSDGNAEVVSENTAELNFPIEIQQQYFERVTLPQVTIPQNNLVKERKNDGDIAETKDSERKLDFVIEISLEYFSDILPEKIILPNEAEKYTAKINPETFAKVIIPTVTKPKGVGNLEITVPKINADLLQKINKSQILSSLINQESNTERSLADRINIDKKVFENIHMATVAVPENNIEFRVIVDDENLKNAKKVQGQQLDILKKLEESKPVKVDFSDIIGKSFGDELEKKLEIGNIVIPQTDVSVSVSLDKRLMNDSIFQKVNPKVTETEVGFTMPTFDIQRNDVALPTIKTEIVQNPLVKQSSINDNTKNEVTDEPSKIAFDVDMSAFEKIVLPTVSLTQSKSSIESVNISGNISSQFDNISISPVNVAVPNFSEVKVDVQPVQVKIPLSISLPDNTDIMEILHKEQSEVV